MSLFRMMLFVLLFAAGSAASAQQFPELTGRVVDGADLLNPQQEAELTGKLEALEQASSRQLVVATIPDLQGYPIEDYGYQLGRHWGIGQSEANNGTILLVAPNQRRVRIEVGYGLEPILTDALSNRIIDETIIPRFKAGDMAGGIAAGADAIIEQLQAPPEVAEQRALEAAAQRQARQGGGSIFPLIFWGIVLAVILGSMIGRSANRFGRYQGRRYGGSGWPIILWTVANEIERGSRGRGSHWGGGGFGGWGGGGFGGGGGGFGGFSGGGGSFGGGGASGSW